MKSPYKRTTYKGISIDEHRKVCKKQYGRKTAGGYHWQYLEECNGNN